MDALESILPPPCSPIKRQVGISIDAFPLSPLSISRSISNISQESDSEEKFYKQLSQYILSLRLKIYILEDDLIDIQNSMKNTSILLLERNIKKEKDLILLRKKLKQAMVLHEMLQDIN